MSRNYRGFVTRPRLPIGLVAVLPPQTRERWDAMNTAYDKAEEATADAAQARTAANNAPDADAAAAIDAARSGKKPPAATVTATAISATEMERYAAALSDLALEAEYEFTSSLTSDRAAIREAVTPELATAVTRITDLLHTVIEPMQQVALLAGLLAWCDRDAPGLPKAKRIVASFGGNQQDVSAFLDLVERTVAGEHPDAVAVRQAAAQAEWEAARGIPQTPDGVHLVHSERGY